MESDTDFFKKVGNAESDMPLTQGIETTTVR
jgi:hypothetical protein